MVQPAHNGKPDLPAVVVAAYAQIHRPVRQAVVEQAGIVGDEQLEPAAFLVFLKKSGAILLVALHRGGQPADEQGGFVDGHRLRPVHQDVYPQVRQQALQRASLFIHQIALMIARAVVDGGDFHQPAAQGQNHVQPFLVRVYHVPRYGDQVGPQGGDPLHQRPVSRAELPVMQVGEHNHTDIFPVSRLGRVKVVKGGLQLVRQQYAPPQDQQPHSEGRPQEHPHPAPLPGPLPLLFFGRIDFFRLLAHCSAS